MDKTFFDVRFTGNAAINSGNGSSWNYPVSGNSTTNALTKGATDLELADTSAFTVGELVQLTFNTTVDESALSAQNPLVFSVNNFPGTRRQITRITAKTVSALKISPGIYHAPTAGTSATVHLSSLYKTGIGLEHFTLLMENGNVTFGINFQDNIGSWISNVRSRNASNYHVYLANCLQCEIRQCDFRDRKTGGSNGAGILCNTSAGCLVEDNAVIAVFPCLEVNHGSCGNVFAYNLFDESGMNINHGPHNSHNLYEGNVTPWMQSDGYFGSDSEEMIFRNWIHGRKSAASASPYSFLFSLNRFSRNQSVIGNIFGGAEWPHNNSPYSFGNPNMGNSFYDGAHEISIGTFPRDLGMSAILTKRTSDTTGEMTLNSGSIRTGQFRTYSSAGELTEVKVLTGISDRHDGLVTALAGGSFSFKVLGNLPPEGAQISIVAGIQGFQDQDRDVEKTTIRKGNWFASTSASPGIIPGEELAGTGLPISMFRTSKPVWFGELAWPPFDPQSPSAANYDAIPAGYRYTHNGQNPPGVGMPPSAPNPPANLRVQSSQ